MQENATRVVAAIKPAKRTRASWQFPPAVGPDSWSAMVDRWRTVRDSKIVIDENRGISKDTSGPSLS